MFQTNKRKNNFKTKSLQLIKRTRKYHPTRTSDKCAVGEVLHILMLNLAGPVKWILKLSGDGTLKST